MAGSIKHRKSNKPNRASYPTSDGYFIVEPIYASNNSLVVAYRDQENYIISIAVQQPSLRGLCCYNIRTDSSDAEKQIAVTEHPAIKYGCRMFAPRCARVLGMVLN